MRIGRTRSPANVGPAPEMRKVEPNLPMLAPAMGLDLSPFAAVSLSLLLWSGAYVAEIVRGGLLGVPAGQMQAAALGLRRWSIYLLVLYPLALRTALPALMGQVVLVVQSTTLGALVGVPEFLKMAQLIVERTTAKPGLWRLRLRAAGVLRPVFRADLGGPAT